MLDPSSIEPWDQADITDDDPRVEPSHDDLADCLDGLQFYLPKSTPEDFRFLAGPPTHAGLEDLTGEALRDHIQLDFRDNVPPLTLENAEMIKGLAMRLLTGRASRHGAGCGSGKTFCAVLATCYLARRGHRFIFLEPTVAVAFEVEGLVRAFAPDVNLSPIYGRPARKKAKTRAYPIYAKTQVVLACHAQLDRAGDHIKLRPFIREIIRHAEKRRQPFHVLVDEMGELVEHLRKDLPLAHRKRVDRGQLTPIARCPVSSRSGNCARCRYFDHAGSVRTDPTTGHPVLRYPKRYDLKPGERGRHKVCDREPDPIHGRHLEVGPLVRVGRTTFARHVLACDGVEPDWESATPEYLEEEDVSPTSAEFLKHLFSCMRNPVLVQEHIVDKAGNVVSPEVMRERKKTGREDWADGVTFPHGTCEGPHLLGTDMLPICNLRAYAARCRASVVFLGATLTDADGEVLEAGFPGIEAVEYPYPARKVRSLAIVMPTGRHGDESLIRDKMLITKGIERHGKVVYFYATARKTDLAYDRVRVTHRSVRIFRENDRTRDISGHHAAREPGQCIVTYLRGVHGVGVNIQDVVLLVIDAEAFRPKRSFNPDELTAEAFEKARAEERVAKLIQVVGRAARGEPGKVVAVILRNADDDLRAAVREMGWLGECSETPPLFPEVGDDLGIIIDQVDRWLEARGGDWPKPDMAAAIKQPRPERGRRDSPAELLGLARDKKAEGMSYREFCRWKHLDRHPEDLREMIKEIFDGS
jgi:hypothetical protein